MAPATRRIKVERKVVLHPTTKQLDEHAMIRLKGKWLSAIFTPDSHVLVERSTFPDGTPILILRPS